MLIAMQARVGGGAVPAPTLVFDDACGFCRRWVARVERWDKRKQIQFLSLRDESAQTLTGRTREELGRAVHFVMPDGAVFAGAAAARELCGFLPFGWLPKAFLGLPGIRSVAEVSYRSIARRWGPVP